MNYAKLEAWRLVAIQLNALKAQEMELRKVFVADAFDTSKEGAQTIDLDEGWQIKMNQPFTRSLDQAKMPEVLKALKKMKADDAVKVKYELAITAYRLLSTEQRKVIDEVLTTKPGSPSLELVPPKNSIKSV